MLTNNAQSLSLRQTTPHDRRGELRARERGGENAGLRRDGAVGRRVAICVVERFQLVEHIALQADLRERLAEASNGEDGELRSLGK